MAQVRPWDDHVDGGVDTLHIAENRWGLRGEGRTETEEVCDEPP